MFLLGFIYHTSCWTYFSRPQRYFGEWGSESYGQVGSRQGITSRSHRWSSSSFSQPDALHRGGKLIFSIENNLYVRHREGGFHINPEMTASWQTPKCILVYISSYPGNCDQSMKWALCHFLPLVHEPIYNFRDQKKKKPLMPVYDSAWGIAESLTWKVRCFMCVRWVRKVTWPYLCGPGSLQPSHLHTLSCCLFAGRAHA